MNIRREITIGAKTSHPLTINRFGYGTMRLTGDFIWGEPKNRSEALQILRTAVDNGIKFLDTADYYGEDVTNRLIAEALYPYPKDLIICTKVGVTRMSNKNWITFDKPQNLRTSIEKNLKTLKIQQIQLVHFRVTTGTDTPFEESLNAMLEMQSEGKILHIGISCVCPEDLNTALTMGNIASVENAFAYGQRTTYNFQNSKIIGMQEVMDICIKNEIPMIPFWSLQNSLPKNEGKILAISEKYNATPAQINLAWLLHFNDLILPIPGTSKLDHFEENLKAQFISLSEEDMKYLN